MMLLERCLIAGTLGLVLASTAGAPGQSPASPGSQNTQQTQQEPGKDSQDMDDAEPAPYHPPAEIGQPAEPPPPVGSHSPAEVSPPAESPAPVQVSPPASPVQVRQTAPEPPLSTDPVERQMQIDTAHLLQLAKELKAEVDKAGNDTLSLAALRKADEVQKLARTLKERMKDRGQVPQNKP